MNALELSDDQRDALLDLLSRDVSDLGMEIADTDRKHFRDALKQRRDLLRSVLEQLRRQVNCTDEGAVPCQSTN